MYRGDQQRYTGQYLTPAFGAWGMQPAPAGHCRQCGQPSGACCCGCRECRKEPRELLVTSAQKDGQSGIAGTAGHKALFAMAGLQQDQGARTEADVINPVIIGAGLGEAFIGGGCCVSLTVEYTPSSPTVKPIVAVLVMDSEGTMLAWMHTDQPGGGYKVKEGIITTNPGAHLYVLVSNATARVRWCEIFSC